MNPPPTQTERWQRFAERVRAQPVGTYRDAGEVAGVLPSVDAAKSLCWRINAGRSVAFADGAYHARSHGTRVSVTYLGSERVSREAG